MSLTHQRACTACATAELSLSLLQDSDVSKAKPGRITPNCFKCQVCQNTLNLYKHCNKSLKLLTSSSFHCYTTSVTTCFLQSSAKAPQVMAAWSLKSSTPIDKRLTLPNPSNKMRQPDELSRDLNVILNAILSLVYWILIFLTASCPTKMEFALQIHTLNTGLTSNWYKSFCFNDTKWRMKAKTLQCYTRETQLPVERTGTCLQGEGTQPSHLTCELRFLKGLAE